MKGGGSRAWVAHERVLVDLEQALVGQDGGWKGTDSAQSLGQGWKEAVERTQGKAVKGSDTARQHRSVSMSHLGKTALAVAVDDGVVG